MVTIPELFLLTKTDNDYTSIANKKSYRGKRFGFCNCQNFGHVIPQSHV